ncbi:pyridoxal phosphate-dependent aminotransferase [Mesorhizobium microcysteis]|uniref:aspartate transaminase n=1 Tax=Neoaquamicrobium microcysteis TaxID=2682781 RepID=A0A5D4H0A0_9HYPH|nr:pyridoxal phosphate-dependent aminotransferase [Mesorhizobium microcysteis]TYR33469.1 pyridoxal phosphate-dependent aminotransferase [Mesorhizobium microcysteis]
MIVSAAPLSRLALGVQPSPTLEMNRRAAELARLGRDIIPLSLGEPDFHTPEFVKATGMAAIERNFTKYTAADGTADLKEALADKLQRHNSIAVRPEDVVVGGGAKILLVAALLTILDVGDEVIVPAPYWTSYPELITLAGGQPVIIDAEVDDGFKLTPECLRAKIGPRTRALVFNSPVNPTGAVYSRSEIDALASVLREHPDVWVVTDELYEHIYFTDERPASFVAVATDLAGRIITVNGFSKGYCMTGWRLGFAAGPRAVMRPIASLLGQIQGAPSSIAQAAGLAALTGDQTFLEINRQTFRERRDVLVSGLSRIDGLRPHLPDGSFYCFVDCSRWLGSRTARGRLLTSDKDVVDALLNEAEISSVHGAAFGRSPFIRLSFALGVDRIRLGLDRLAKFRETMRASPFSSTFWNR